ncbi:hypothetical protein JTE90_007452 [Oedothorax gibbosus]|uniref:RFX-type winged-helix domain-containing protein n=1 Tax=Oedothorax gibbosus TaxID=931172 RepID=A0AAV6U8J7_9ARAC|nr:hypothetical protein JTE90_007452 [Oedothorax gibbosus]
MNAITMKLENKQPSVSSKDKFRASIVGKKCKSNRKKSISANTDKDALQNNHGMGRKPGDKEIFSNIKLYDSLDSNSSKKSRPKKTNPKPNEKMPPKAEKMQERIEQFLSTDVRDKVTSILNDVRALSDVEKLFLYLQLPTGTSFEMDSFKSKTQNPLGKKADEEGMIAVTWIQSHFEEDPDVSLPKQEVYNEYQAYCQMTGTECLCAADFGKVMKQIFPSVKPRRLGTRGNSRYCYSGLRKKLKLESPGLPDMQADEENSEIKEENITDEATVAACHVLFEWAEKLLGIKFTSLKTLASHLLENMYVDNRSVAAFTVLLEGSPQLLEKGFSNCEGGIKKSDAQVHLQRKIQEKELIKEQKKKLQEQRSSLAILSKGKAGGSKKKTLKSKKSKLATSEIYDVSSFCVDKESDSYPTKSSEGSCEAVSEEDKIPFQIKEEEFDSTSLHCSTKSPILCDVASVDQFSPSQIITPHTSPGSSTEIEDNVKKKNKIMIPSNKTPVSIAQSLPGIIILSDIGKQNLPTPKYKRIQPKPLRNESFSAVMRARAGSVGSSLVNKPKGKGNDGRRSSHAWLQSVYSPDNGEDKPTKNSSNVRIVSLRTSPQKSIVRKDSFVAPKDIASEKSVTISENSPSGDDEIVSNFFQKHISSKSISELISKSGLADNCTDSSLPSDENGAVKRHIDGNEESSACKRPHLDSASGSMQPNCTVEEEVSVRDIEGDALIDYLRGANTNLSILSSLQQAKQKLESEQLSSNNQVKQLSQLRMLLEQNLPRRMAGESAAGLSKDGGQSKPSSALQESVLFSSQPTKSSIINGKKLFSDELAQTILESPSNLCNAELTSISAGNDKLDASNQISAFERLLSYSDLTPQTNVNEQHGLLTNPSIFLNNAKSDTHQIDTSVNSNLSDLGENTQTDNLWLESNVIPSAAYVPNQINNSLNSVRVSTYTQVPSVPQSPNTRRRAFNFMPISPRHTPIPDSLNTCNASNISSPGPNQYPRNMMSKAVGTSQPPSNAGSPFVSPRSTPISMCRSRHSSGQSTSRHTPFQNFDSGVSSVSSSPFISPQPTPVPVSRLRHNSSHSNKTVTFCSVNSPQIIHSQPNSLGQLRTRHSSGPGGPHLSGGLCTARSAPLSPLVTDQFIFPSGNEVRSRHNSGSNTTTPLSPVSEQASSSSSCTSNLPDLTSVTETAASTISRSFLNASAADLLINGNQTNFKQVRQRHASSSVIYNKPYLSMKDNFSSEIQNLLKNAEDMSGVPNSLFSNRSQSVPLHQMLQNLDTFCFLNQQEDPPAKSHPTTPVMNHMFSFPIQDNSVVLSSNDLQKSLTSSGQMDWALEGGDLERRNLTSLLDPPISDDLQTTLEDLRDCDTDFSKFAQELELSQNEDGSYEVK